MRDLAVSDTPVGEMTICELHRRIVVRSQPDIAGFYSRLPRRIAGSAAIFPSPVKIPNLMEQFGGWLTAITDGPASAFEAHFRLTAIHPFADGNGRTARLLMNLLLIRNGYPPVAVRPEDRIAYLEALERGSADDDLRPFQQFMQFLLDATLDAYLGLLRQALPSS